MLSTNEYLKYDDDKKWDDFVYDLIGTMATDSNNQAPPITANRNSRAEIDSSFNYAAYQKV